MPATTRGHRLLPLAPKYGALRGKDRTQNAQEYAQDWMARALPPAIKHSRRGWDYSVVLRRARFASMSTGALASRCGAGQMQLKCRMRSLSAFAAVR